MAVGVIAAAVGIATSLFGQADAGRRQKRAAKKAREAAARAAAEILRRAKVNAEFIIEEGTVLSGAQATSFARAGVDVGSGSPLRVQEETISRAFRVAEEEITQGRQSGGTLLTDASNRARATSNQVSAGNIRAAGNAAVSLLQLNENTNKGTS